MVESIYLKFPSQTSKRSLFLLENSLPELKKIDTIIFDIDGVIVDDRQSFRAAISKTIQHYFRIKHRLKGRKKLVKISETQLFKNAGGFNNDWELTEAAILFYLFKYLTKRCKNFSELRDIPPSLTEFTERIKKSGGGLKSVLRFVKEESQSIKIASKIIQSIDKNLIRQIFQELYAGERASFIYGIQKRLLKNKKGLYQKETKLLNEKLLDPNHFSYGILTGRTKEETDLVLEYFPVLKEVVFKNIKFDDGGKVKPDPDVLKPLIKSSKSFIYIGDTVDDFKTVDNFRKKSKNQKAFFGAVTCDKTTRDLFTELKADIISDNVNDLLSILYTFKKESHE